MEKWITGVELWADALTMPVAVVAASLVVSAAFLVAVFFVTSAFLAWRLLAYIQAFVRPHDYQPADWGSYIRGARWCCQTTAKALRRAGAFLGPRLNRAPAGQRTKQ